MKRSKTKKEIARELIKKEEEKYYKFLKFMKWNGYKETIDENGSLITGKPLFYKKINDKIYFAFTLPSFPYYRKKNFFTDFWKIYATSEKDFLKKKISPDKVVDLKLGFDLEMDNKFYYDQLDSINNKN